MRGYYAGIGSRKTPPEILEIMGVAAQALADMGLVLRTGGANGADQAFFNAVEDQPHAFHLYIPWEGFQGFTGKDAPVHVHKGAEPHIRKWAENIAKQFHPNWVALSDGAKLLMSRNSYQVLGSDLKSPALFVLCWTPGGREIGGTAQAIRMANYFKIPVINLGSISPDEANDQILEILHNVRTSPRTRPPQRMPDRS
jgi:hypothetical protein